jgi:type IV pilus assembly protein PilC
MKRFSYKAKDQKTGKVVKNSIQAESERLAGKLLMERGFLPLEIKEESLNGGINKVMNRVTMKDKIIFTRQFATLIGSGLPLADSLRTVADQTSNKLMKGIVEDMLSSVEGGKPLSEAMDRYPDVFNNVYRALIGAGEMSGTLDKALIRLAEQQEKDAETISRVRGAMVYPAIVMVVMVAVMLFMVFSVVPQVEALYKDLGQTLPMMTLILVWMTNFILSFWWLILAIFVALGWLFWQWLHTESGIKFKDNFKLNVPLFNKLTRRLYMARFARTAQTLLTTGVAMLDVLHISGEAMNNTVVQKEIDDAADKVKGGSALSTSLKDKQYIMPLLPQMIYIGEQSGKIDDMLGKAAQVYEDELEEEVRNLSTMIEPILMVVLALMAGGLIAAVLLPIYQLVNIV